MRLATFNLLHGRSLSDGEVVVDRLRDAVRDLDADVLGLQEVDRAQERSHHLDLTAEAADAMGGEGRFVPAIMGTPGLTWRAAKAGDETRIEHAAYGVSLVSRLPVVRWGVTRLPSAPMRSPVLMPGPRRRVMWLRDEPRVLVAAVVRTPAGEITVANTHLSFVPGWNGAQLRRVARVLRTMPGPRVLLGDLNLPGRLPARVLGWRSLAIGPTFPAPAPRMQIDHALGDAVPAGADHSPLITQLPLSDHRALSVEIDL
jgi:endonuclease/exonuclease/phosphatase family metal-dependent hydrolase